VSFFDEGDEPRTTRQPRQRRQPAGDRPPRRSSAAPDQQTLRIRQGVAALIVLLVLIALCIEWAVYHRDAVARIRRGFAARLGRAPGGSA